LSLFGHPSCPTATKDFELSFVLSPEIAEIAALSNANPGAVRSTFLQDSSNSEGRPIFIFPPDATVSAVNPPALQQSGIPFPNLTPLGSSNLSGLTFPAPTILSSLTPLAFISGFSDPNFVFRFSRAGATLLSDPAANSFFYAVTTGASGQLQTLKLFFDYLPQTQTTFAKGQDLGDIVLPLVVLNRDGSERSVATTLQIRSACTGGSACLTAGIVGDFFATGTMQQHSAAELGLIFNFHFGPSPNSAIPHAIFEVQVPLLVTLANDPAYFGVKTDLFGRRTTTGINQISGYPTAFHGDVLGFSPAFLGVPIGIAPGAASFAASFSNNGDGVSRPAVAVFLAIGTDGATVGHVPRFCAGFSGPGGRSDGCKLLDSGLL
jgi:hypothetical protein